mmetsp:Transcript_37001/g.78927  ORF Transcript_37001/g.78927 Transcript_37001/m.78927 type:complete len:237 (+) Transcript_37001:446-1156(+)
MEHAELAADLAPPLREPAPAEAPDEADQQHEARLVRQVVVATRRTRERSRGGGGASHQHLGQYLGRSEELVRQGRPTLVRHLLPLCATARSPLRVPLSARRQLLVDVGDAALRHEHAAAQSLRAAPLVRQGAARDVRRPAGGGPRGRARGEGVGAATPLPAPAGERQQGGRALARSERRVDGGVAAGRQRPRLVLPPLGLGPAPLHCGPRPLVRLGHLSPLAQLGPGGQAPPHAAA